MQPHSQIAPQQPIPRPVVCVRTAAEELDQINRALDEQAVLGSASEQFIQEFLDQLLGSGLEDRQDYWLTLARLAELTLYSAACLALAGEFAACGDLMFNPGGKLLHLKGSAQPFALKRHRSVTRQVAHLVPTGWQTIDWLKRQTYLEIPRQAVLPQLRKGLANRPRPNGYLEIFDQDQKRLASSLALLMSLGTKCSAGPQEALSQLCRCDRLWLESRLFRPDLERFHELGGMLKG